MQVKQLIELLTQYDPAATIVVCDRTDFFRWGLLRPLAPEELRPVLLGERSDEDVRWVCAWNERSVESDDPQSGLLMGPT